MQASIQINVTPPRWLQTKTRRKAAALALAAVLLIPGLVFASHSFTDVPDSNSFHANIGRVAGAGITAGCTATTYCPTANVTRGQMAAFLARSAGRVASDQIGFPFITPTVSTIGSVTIRAGDVTGGVANVLAQVDLSAFSYDVPSEATVKFNLYHGTELVGEAWVMVPTQGTESYGIASTSISAVVPVPTGLNQTFSVDAELFGGATNVQALGNLTATYIPFSGLGQNASVLSVTGSGRQPLDAPPAP